MKKISFADVVFFLCIPITVALCYATVEASPSENGGPAMCCFMVGAIGLIAYLAGKEDAP